MQEVIGNRRLLIASRLLKVEAERDCVHFTGSEQSNVCHVFHVFSTQLADSNHHRGGCPPV